MITTGRVAMLLPGPGGEAVLIMGWAPPDGSWAPADAGGLSGPAWLDKVVDWWNRSSAKITKVVKKAKSALDRLKGWAREQREAYVIEDCGRLYVIDSVRGGGIAYHEVTTTEGRKVIAASSVPGWVSPCKDLPPPTSGLLGGQLGAYLPYIALAGGLLLVVLLVSGGKRP